MKRYRVRVCMDDNAFYEVVIEASSKKEARQIVRAKASKAKIGRFAISQAWEVK